MTPVKLNVLGISSSQMQNGSYILIMSEQKGMRRLPIVIGSLEAQSITIALEEKLKPSRPMTHDLFEDFARRFDIEIKQVVIHKLVDGIFYSNIICQRNGIEDIFDARSSDSIALAIRFKAPVYTYNHVLDMAGIIIDLEEEEHKKSHTENPIEDVWNKPKVKKNKLEHFNPQELKKMLDGCIKLEDYEKAAQIRDEIIKRNK